MGIENICLSTIILLDLHEKVLYVMVFTPRQRHLPEFCDGRLKHPALSKSDEGNEQSAWLKAKSEAMKQGTKAALQRIQQQ